MKLRILLGRAGTGKTHTCLEEITRRLRQEGEEGPPLILLVPEQATYQMERALLDRLPAWSGSGGPEAAAATTRAQIVSFRRLEQRVFQEAGGVTRPFPSELAKRLLLRLALARCEGDLELFGRAARRPGFVERLSRTIRELRDHGVEAAALTAAAAALEAEDPALAARLRDLTSVLTGYEALLAARFTDPDRSLAAAARRLAGARSLRGAAIWVDGFAGFTPAEFGFLEALLGVAEEMTVALCLDGRRPLGHPPSETDVFRQTHETYHRLTRLAERLGAAITGVEVLDTDAPPPRFAERPALAWIESWLFHTGRPRREAPDPGDTVELLAAVDPRAEVEAAAQRIRRLCREEGLRPREIAVVVRSLDPYAEWIRRIFTDYGIPYFIDRKGGLSHHPLLELVRSALELVERDWPADAVFRYLKTDLSGVDRDAVDRLEPYVRAHGIRGRWWYGETPWRFRRLYSLEAEPEDLDAETAVGLDELDAERRRAAAPLVRLQERLHPSRTDPQPAGQLVQAVIDLLADLDAASTLTGWVEEAERRGDLLAAREHRHAWDSVAGVLEVCAEVLGDEPLTLAEFRQVLEGALEGLQLGLIPPALDQVLVGSVERSRQPDVRAVFVLGANEGVFPAVPEEDPLFGDTDREALAGVGVELAPDSRLRLFHERYLAYIALTRSRERLFVSYALTDGSGGERKPSPVVTRLRELFPALREEPGPGAEAPDPAAPPDLTRYEHPHRLAGALLPLLRAARRGAVPDPAWWGAWRWLAAHPVHGEHLRRLAGALGEPRPVPDLPPDLARALFGDVLKTSVSRLERFAACPFQHFALHGLRLEEPPTAEIDPARLGSLMHAVLSRLTGDLQAAGRSLSDLTPGERRAAVDEAVDAIAPRLAAELVLDSARQAYLLGRVKEILAWVAEVLVEQERRGRFAITAAEVSFGLGGEGGLPPLRLDLPGGGRALVRGRIDRVDAADLDGEIWLRVVDYKSSARSLALDEVYHGLSLQLLAYLAVALETAPRWLGRPARPAGAYYQPMVEPVVDEPVGAVGAGAGAGEGGAAGADGAAAARLERLKASRLAGVTAADPRVIRAMDSRLEAGVSELVEAGLNRDGSPRKSPRVAPEPALLQLLDLVRRRMAELAAGIRSGRIAPRPYRKPAGETPCGYCPFHGVCRFEGAYGAYRDLRPVDSRAFWAEVTGS